MISRKIGRWLVPLLWLVCFVCQAAAGYTVSTAVPSKAESVRLTAWRAALAELLVQHSGNRDVGSLPVIQSALDQSARYVMRYDYAEGDGEGLVLNTVFSRTGVQAVLQSAGESPWAAPALPLLVIPSLDLEGSVSALHAVFDAVARSRGLTLRFASMDLADQSHLASFSGITPETRAWFAERYQTHLLLFVDIAHHDFNGTNQSTTLQAHLYLEGSPYAWRTVSNTLSMGARELIEQAVDTVVRDVPTSAAALSGSDWVIEVRGVDSIVTYHEVVAWVTHVVGRDAGLTENLTPTGVALRFRSRLSPQVLADRLQAGGKLVPVAQGLSGDERHSVYTWGSTAEKTEG